MTHAMKQECPSCGQMLRIAQRQVSRTIRCSKCAHIFEPGQTHASSNSSIEMYPAADSVETIVNAQLDTQADGQQKVSGERSEQSPRTLGRFQLKRLLGQGGFGKVYLAFDPQLERNVAIKVLTAAGNSPIRIQRFMVEAKSAARLKHPYIVPTFESGKEDSRYYIASEFIEGKLLSDEATQKSMDERASVACIQKLATALAYAHERQVVHRDVKPQNIILDAAGAPHLMDFGLARRTDEESNLTTDGAMLGTPAYMSPEQARGEFAKVGPASDQYSLAVVLYQLLCGSTPFDGLPHVVVTQVAQGDVPPLKTKRPDISADLAAVCEKAMQKLPGDRYPSCADFAEDLAAWMEGRPVAARPLGVIQKALRLVAAHKAIAGMASVTLLLMVVLAFSVWKIMMSPGDETTQVAGDSSSDAAELLQDEVVVVVSGEPDWQPSFALSEAGKTAAKTEAGVVTPDHAVTPFTSEAAKVFQKQWAEHLKLPVEFTNTLGMKFVLIPPGEFYMGTPKAVLDAHLEEVKDVAQWRECVLSETPLHRVILTRPYYVGVYEVTQKEYALVMHGAPSHFSSSGAGAKLVSDLDTQQLPVESMTWSEASDFCQKLGAIERTAAPADLRGALANLRSASLYRLPTEAEWEFACTAGTRTMFWTGDRPEDLQNVAWFHANNADHTQPVGQLPANPFGLHDVHGNVTEWVGDIWAPEFYRTSIDTPAVDPVCSNPNGGPYVARGGGFGVSANHCRSSARHYGDSSTRLRDLGFRVVLEIDPVRSGPKTQLVESSGAGGASLDAAVAAVTAAGPNASSTRTSSEIDLLSQINPVQCAYFGNWKRTVNGLESPPGNGMRLQVPFLPDGEYDLRLVVKPLENKMGLTIGLVSEGHPFHAILDYYNHYHALEQVDGLDLSARPASASNSGRVDKADQLTLNQNNIIVCRVRKNGVTIEVNEKPLIAWKGSAKQLSRNSYWNMPIDRSLFIGGFSRFECSRLTLTPLTGTVQPVPPWRLTTAAGQSLATGLLGISEETMKRLANTWSLSLNDEFGSEGEVALDLRPRSEVVSTAQGLITFDDIQFLTTLSCPIRVTLARLDSKSCSVENVQRLAAMKNLRRLYIAENGAMPANFTELLGANRSLRELVLGPQKLKEQQVTELCRIATLQRLQLNFTDLSDESVRIITNSLPKLESLHIGHMGPQSRLTNDCVKSVSALSSLTELSVRDSKAIDDKCVDDLLKLRNLRALWIDGTSITQSGFERLKSKLPATMITWKL